MQKIHRYTNNPLNTASPSQKKKKKKKVYNTLLSNFKTKIKERSTYEPGKKYKQLKRYFASKMENKQHQALYTIYKSSVLSSRTLKQDATGAQ